LSSQGKEPVLISEIAQAASSGSKNACSAINPNIQECFTTIEGARMRYLRAGSGPPVILLHGLLAYSFSWRFTIPALALEHTVYAPDMLGAGFSDRPAGLETSLRACAQRILRFADQAGIESFDLVGNSHGGAVAMMLAALCGGRQDPRLQRLILVAPVNPWSRHGRFFAPLMGSAVGSFLFKLTAPHMRFTYRFWLARLYGDPRRIPPGTVEGYSAPYKIPGTFEYGLSIVRRWTADLDELESIMPKIADYPALLIWGSRDRAVDPSSAEALWRVFKNSKLVMCEGAGHLPCEEVPDEFNRAVVNFLGSSPRKA
jgi:pimeloyl-ACP methyl ester carboxylesterase